MVHYLDQVLIPGYLCDAFMQWKPWQCCGGCDGCDASCSAGREPVADVIVDAACAAFCAGRLPSADLRADDGAASANKTALAGVFTAPALPADAAPP